MQNITIKKEKLTSFVLFFFFILIISLALVSEIFQKLKISINSDNLYSNPFSKVIENNVKKINIIRNENKVVEISKNENTWSLAKNSGVRIKSEIITDLLEFFKNIEIYQIHQKEPINLSNFHLNKPQTIIQLFDANDKLYEVSIGLFNAFEDSSFITLNNVNSIFQIKNTNKVFEKLELNTLLDSRVFPIEYHELSNLKVQNNHIGTTHSFSVNDKTGDWISDKYKTISQELTSNLIKNIIGIKASYILDELSTEKISEISKALSAPILKITINTKLNKEIQFTISSISKSISGLKIDPKGSLVVRSNIDDIPYLIEKSSIDFFKISYNDIKPKAIDRFIY